MPVVASVALLVAALPVAAVVADAAALQFASPADDALEAAQPAAAGAADVDVVAAGDAALLVAALPGAAGAAAAVAVHVFSAFLLVAALPVAAVAVDAAALQFASPADVVLEAQPAAAGAADVVVVAAGAAGALQLVAPPQPAVLVSFARTAVIR